jgi:hypothetical protein
MQFYKRIILTLTGGENHQSRDSINFFVFTKNKFFFNIIVQFYVNNNVYNFNKY